MNQNPHEFKILLVQLAIFSEHVHRGLTQLFVNLMWSRAMKLYLTLLDLSLSLAWKQQRLDEMFN